ncbi:uncharacterized protein LOC115160933 [Salmo trutta]|uniref:uncharacterized protein LOC115160933 n=1 Tax=Salmo trutta TaxID=8032 RepID=UPI0011315BA6|nr:uncharacterized protein LOC115160933 [Salmo trutta]
MMRRFLQPLMEYNALTGNLGAASSNSVQPALPSQPKTTEKLLALKQNSFNTSRIPVLELTEERKGALQRLASLKAVEKKPHPPSRIPVLQKKRSICNGKSQGLHVAPTSQQSGKATVPSIRKPLQPIRTKRDQTYVVKDIYLHSAKPMKAVHGANMVAKMPLPPIRARVTVPNSDAKKKPFQPVRPEGSPRPAASKYRRQVVKKHIQFKTQTLTVQDLPPCPDEMVWDVFNSEAEQVMAYMKAKLISVTQELKLIKSGAKMDAQALEEKNAKVRLRKKVEKFIQEICLMKVDSDLWEMIRDNEEEEEEEERIKEVRRNGEESSVASKPKETATRYTVSKPKEVKKGLNMEEKKEDRQVVLKRRFGMSAVNSKLKQCEHCGRCFDPSRLEKHSEIYAKLSSKSSRRGVYDSTMHRLKGTVLAGYVKRSVM